MMKLKEHLGYICDIKLFIFVNIKKYIKNYIIFEAAIKAEQASSQGISMIIREYSGASHIILYDSNKFIEIFKESIETIGDPFDTNVPIIGFMSIKSNEGKCNGSSFIDGSAAIKGYGPLVYDIGMSISKNNTLSPDRKMVSDKAKSVWSYYKNNRSDVIKKPYDDIHNPRTEDPEDDCFLHGKEPGESILDISYTLKSDVNYQSLLKNHEKCFDILKQIYNKISENWFDLHIVKSAETFFYNNIMPE